MVWYQISTIIFQKFEETQKFNQVSKVKKFISIPIFDSLHLNGKILEQNYALEIRTTVFFIQ